MEKLDVNDTEVILPATSAQGQQGMTHVKVCCWHILTLPLAFMPPPPPVTIKQETHASECLDSAVRTKRTLKAS